MGKKRQYIPGQRWHVSANGRVGKCTASVRACPHSAHFDTQEEAESPRERLAHTVTVDDIVTFEVPIGAPTFEALEGDLPRPSLRKASEQARDLYARTGRRPSSPLGAMQVTLPGGQKLDLKRETFTMNDRHIPVGARYYIRYFSSDVSYEHAFVDLNTPIDNILLQKQLQEYFTSAATNLSDPVERAKLMDLFEETSRKITEVEIMARGSENAMKHLGMDLFDKSDPLVHTLATSYSASTLQPYDVTEALRLHASKDASLKDVAIHVSEPFPGNPKYRWTLDRLPEGDWYVGATTFTDFTSTPVEGPGEASAVIAKSMRLLGVSERVIAEHTAYAEQFLSEVEPAIRSYQATVRARVGDPEEDFDSLALDDAANPYVPEPGVYGDAPQGTNERLWGLFS